MVIRASGHYSDRWMRFACTVLGLSFVAAACSAEQQNPPKDAGVAPSRDATVVIPPDGGAPQQDAAVDPNLIPAYAQRDGDPNNGYRVLVNEGYVGCGLPRSAYDMAIGDAPPELRLPGR